MATSTNDEGSEEHPALEDIGILIDPTLKLMEAQLYGQCRQHGHGMPVALGCAFRHPFSARSAAIIAGHLRAGPALIQKHQRLRVDLPYALLPRLPALPRCRRFLLLGVE